MSKKKIELHAEKNQVPQGAWLAYHFQQDGPGDDPLSVPEYAAFTTGGAAKRYLASVVGRSRITWTDIDGDGMSLISVVEVKD
jgi:hypothetical protein